MPRYRYRDIKRRKQAFLPLWFLVSTPERSACPSEMRNTMKAAKLMLPLLLVAALLISGCAWFNKEQQERPAQELIEEGVAAFDKGEYKKALESFEQLKDWYPFSKYAILAELKIADAHYHLKEYPEAITAYEEFERLHPRNEATPYVVYQIGRCYFEQMDSIDRDQTPARKAVETFSRLIRQYPGDPYSQKAGGLLVTCYHSLAGNEFYIGRYYYKQGFYRAALHRFMSLIKEYPDAGEYQYAALKYIAECEAYQPVDNSTAP